MRRRDCWGRWLDSRLHSPVMRSRKRSQFRRLRSVSAIGRRECSVITDRGYVPVVALANSSLVDEWLKGRGPHHGR
jgi:hypothetical protein